MIRCSKHGEGLGLWILRTTTGKVWIVEQVQRDCDVAVPKNEILSSAGAVHRRGQSFHHLDRVGHCMLDENSVSELKA